MAFLNAARYTISLAHPAVALTLFVATAAGSPAVPVALAADAPALELESSANAVGGSVAAKQAESTTFASVPQRYESTPIVQELRPIVDSRLFEPCVNIFYLCLACCPRFLSMNYGSSRSEPSRSRVGAFSGIKKAKQGSRGRQPCFLKVVNF